MANSLQNMLDTGAQLLAEGRLDEAWILAELMLRQNKGNPTVLLYVADTAAMRGDRRAAIACLESLPQSLQGSAAVLLRKTEFLYQDSQRDAALQVARSAAHVLEREPWQYHDLAAILTACHDQEAARTLLQRALELLPPNPQLLYDLALVEFQLNRADDAERHIESLLQIEPFHASALHLRSALRTQTPECNHIDDLQDRLARQPAGGTLEVQACFALAKEYEDLQQYAESFAFLQRGARARRGALAYDSASELAAHEAIRARFERAEFDTLAEGYLEESPIFIVGMPRTGTTLVERLLGSHSQVVSIGEFTEFPQMFGAMMAQAERAKTAERSAADLSLSIDFHELGRRYAAAARQLAGGSPRFVDKLPYNFLYCGYILAALPKARILHLTRDPLDTCYAVYKTLFFNAYSYSYDLEELADYYISYRRQMAHWHQVLPGRILDVSYEQLVREPQAQARRILQWCGLPWEDAVLDFHQQDGPATTASAMQVRRPMYTDSIGSGSRAGSGMDPLRDRLLRAGLIEAGPA